ncbi:methyltransferase [Streptomyces sp. ODS28]|uniref:methyltransferase n=1 Tax=Streptomyces sp. ODS28 TaxID=3136688 RepID=UPI0031EDF4F5
MTSSDAQPDGPRTGAVPPLFDLMYGHIGASVLRTVVQYGIPDLLAEGPRTAEDLAAASGAQAGPLRRLLRLLATRGLFAEDADGTFALTEEGTLLRSDVPGSQHAPALMYTDEMFRRAAEGLAETLRTGEPGFEAAYGLPFFEHLAAKPEKGSLFDAAMTTRISNADERIAAACPLPAGGTAVDVGGGRGALLSELLTRSPGLHGVLYDRPETVAEHLLDTEELKGRWRAESGDFFTGVPSGGDVYLLKNILHDWPDEDCLRILGTLRAAVTPGTRLLVIDAVLPGDGTPHPAVSIDIIMLMMVRGKERTAAEFEELLSRSGFRFLRVLPTGVMPSIVEAEAV